jgi:predicted ATP-dependent protease
VKVVLIGRSLVYDLLYALDEDFGELFKVKVDFDDSFPRTEEHPLLYARLVAGACQEEGLRSFGADGVACLIEHGSRLVSHKERLSARPGLLLDLSARIGLLGRAGGPPDRHRRRHDAGHRAAHPRTPWHRRCSTAGASAQPRREGG